VHVQRVQHPHLAWRVRGRGGAESARGLEEVERKGGGQARVLLRREEIGPHVGARRIWRSMTYGARRTTG
jgi:hypothetical protein